MKGCFDACTNDFLPSNNWNKMHGFALYRWHGIRKHWNNNRFYGKYRLKERKVPFV